MDRASCRRIIFSSSAAVYGEPRYLPFDEAHPCGPVNVYGRTKHMAEQVLIDWQCATPVTSVVLLRYFKPVGAHPSGRIGEDLRDIPNSLMPFVAQVAVGARIFPDQTIHGFDSFEGLPEDWSHVLKGAFGEIKGALPDNVRLYKGWFEDTLPEWFKLHGDKPISLLAAARTQDVRGISGHPPRHRFRICRLWSDLSDGLRQVNQRNRLGYTAPAARDCSA